MDRQTVKLLRVEIEQALELVRAKHSDMHLGVGSITFTDIGFRGTLICEEQNSDGVSKKFTEDWAKAVSLGYVQQEWLGVETLSRRDGKTMKVIGYDFKKRKNNIILQDVKTKKIWISTKSHFLNPVFKHDKKEVKSGLIRVDR